ncbi:MAG: S1/P1 nuclease [Candidatus Accumulibacter meliphilus]|uniref:S1/P1 nuclease n=1 Tax=Candidatus Accumulibacter meliphilus TaxID=2211374 RepID=UPI002FC2B669
MSSPSLKPYTVFIHIEPLEDPASHQASALTAKPGAASARRGLLLRPGFVATALLSLLLLFPSPAVAWNAAGHRITALIAWEKLDQGSKSALAALLRKHPDFERWQARSKDPDADRAAFLEASTWPDDIRRDRRFYTAGRAQPTPTLKGFPDMERRLGWHYVDRPLHRERRSRSSPGVLDRQLTALAKVLCDSKRSDTERAYALPWLIHLVGDAHQPLHAASRNRPNGKDDSGGNAQRIINPFQPKHQSTNLHSYWDDLPGKPWLRDKRLESTVKALTSLYPAAAPAGEPAQWLDESWQLAQRAAYPPGKDAVLTISAQFHASALKIAGRRLGEAGYRLADQLRRLFGKAGERQCST